MPTAAVPTSPQRGRRRVAPAALLAALLLSAGCGGGEGTRPTEAVRPPPATGGPPPPPPTPSYDELWIEGWFPEQFPEPRVLAADTVEQFGGGNRRARARRADGTVVAAPVTWASGDSTLLRVVGTSTSDVVTVVPGALGATTLTVRLGALTTTIPVVVTPIRVRGAYLRRAPTASFPWPTAMNLQDSVIVRGTARYVAQCTSRPRGDGRLLDLPVSWRTNDPARASVDSTGTLTARALGPVTLTAVCTGTQGETAEVSAVLMVRPPRAARIAFTYAPDSLILRRADSVRAVLYDSLGAPTAVPARVDLYYGTYGTSEFPIPEAVEEGTVTARFLMDGELVASGDGLTARRRVRFVPVPQAPPVTYPAVVAAVAGTSVLLATRAVDLDGFAFAGTPAPTFASADPGVASVTVDGVVTAGAPGTTTIRVSTGRTHTDVPVAVVLPGAFTIDVRPDTLPFPAAVSDAMAEAVRRWQRAVVGDLPDLRLTLPEGACGLAAPPTEPLTIDDVLVFASVDRLDGPGGVLAQAGPCIIREDGTAAVGRVQIDSADVSAMAAGGRLADVLQHEIGHVLGIGTLWQRRSLGLVARSGDGYGYVGRRGLGVARWWERVTSTPQWSVPLAEAAGPGDGHWSEAMFGAELMTPLLDRLGNPLSLLTLEALGDLGYVTSAAGADPFQLYGRASQAGLRAGRAAAEGRRAPGVPFDRVLRARWRARPAGRLQPARLQRLTP